MIIEQLQSAILDIDALVSLTKTDIEDIKEARHDKLADRLQQKENLINSFEQKKARLNRALLELTSTNPQLGIDALLSDKERALLEFFKEKLAMLKAVNKEYAKFVAAISEFYNSLIDSMFTLDGNGYEKNTLRPATIFRMSA